MGEKIALVYWPDTTGHAARSIPLAHEIEERGHDLVMAGGGFGARFVETNGFELAGLTDFEVFPESDSKVDLVKHLVTHTVPRGAKRLGELFGWMREEQPDKVVTDDILCVVAATLLRIDFYRVENWTPDMFDFPLSFLYGIYDKFTLTFGEKIVLTSLWPDEEAPDGVERVGPLAQEGEEGDVEGYDVLLMPGSFGEEFCEMRRELEERGLDTEMVGAEDWDIKPSMTPYTGAAELTICTGFSSIADSVVGGTPCLMYPHLFLQKGIARGIEERELEGIETVESSEEALQKTLQYLENGCDEPNYENGAERFVDVVED